MESIQRYWKRTDKAYLSLCLLSSILAVLALSSWAAKQGSGFAVDEVTGAIAGVGDYRRAVVQAGAAGIGLVVAILLSNIDYRSLVKVWPVHVAVTWGLVLPTLFIRNVSIGPLTIGYNAGDTDNYSWYKLGGFTFQPTELAKISFILTFAMHLNNVRGRINEPKELGKLLLHMLVPIGIIHIQGDDGTAIIYGIIACSMMFAAGLSWKYIIGAVWRQRAWRWQLAFAFFSDKIGKGYQWYRILAVHRPGEQDRLGPQRGHLEEHHLPAAARRDRAGQRRHLRQRPLWRRLLQCAQRPQRLHLQLDRQCSRLCGLLRGAGGAACHRHARPSPTGARSEDLLGTFICAGIGGALMAQIFVNVGMNLRVLPVIGVTLPFYSAGGSSVLMLYICVGLVLSVYMHNTKKLFG